MLSQPARVAIVDDDVSVLKALSRLLGTCSYRTATYRSAREFLDSLQHSLPECLVVDMQMPEFTGLDLLHHLTRHGIQIPSIVITGHDEAGVRERCEAVGTRAYLLKPLRGEALIAAIDAATGRERAEEDASPVALDPSAPQQRSSAPSTATSRRRAPISVRHWTKVE